MFHNLINNISSNFVRNVLKISSGTIIGQAVPFLISPILTRFYSPDIFGKLALYLSVFNIFAIISTFRLELALVIDQDENNIPNIFGLSIICSLIVSALALIIFIIFKFFLPNTQLIQEIDYWLLLIPFSIVTYAIQQNILHLNIRNKSFGIVGKNKIIQSISTGFTNISLGFYNHPFGLIIGNFLGIIASVLHLNTNISISKYLIPKNILSNLKTYKSLILFNTPNAFVDNLRFLIINFSITSYYGQISLGFYSLGFKLVQTPIAIIGSSVSQVFFQRINEHIKSGEILLPILKKFLLKQIMIALPIFFLIYFSAPLIFKLYLGKEWGIAGIMSQKITPWLALSFLSSPYATVYTSLQRHFTMLVYSILYALIPYIIFKYNKDFELLDSLSIVSFSIALLLVVFIGNAFFYAQVHDQELAISKGN